MTLAPPATHQPTSSRIITVQQIDSNSFRINWLCSYKNTPTPPTCTIPPSSALAYMGEREAKDRDFPPSHIFETPQLVAPGRTDPRRTLPSFLFLEDGQPVGVYAREQGALVPTKLVHSAKSWLSNPDVDRTAKILPWDSPETGR